MKKTGVTILMFLAVMFVWMTNVHAITQQEVLNQYVAELQKNPGDTAMREKIISYVQTMKPAPATPEEAKRFLARGKAAFRDAKEPKDFSDAADEFKKALLYAPWLAEGYYNLGIIQDKAGQYGDAMQSLNFYLLAAPNAPDAGKVKELIYEIEYRKDKAAKESSLQELKRQQEEQQREAPKILLRQLKAKYDGATYSALWCSYTSQSGCFADQNIFPCGCNESETHGSNWYDHSIRTFYISFPSDGTIIFRYDWMGQNYIMLRGTPKGPALEDIFWEQNMGSDNIQWKPCWVKLINGFDKIMFSPGGVANRPVDDSQFSPYTRYRYDLLNKN